VKPNGGVDALALLHGRQADATAEMREDHAAGRRRRIAQPREF